MIYDDLEIPHTKWLVAATQNPLDVDFTVETAGPVRNVTHRKMYVLRYEAGGALFSERLNIPAGVTLIKPKAAHGAIRIDIVPFLQIKSRIG
jgi:hypothetical protein